MQVISELNIEIGRIPLLIKLDSTSIAREISALYEPFITEKNHVFKIHIITRAHISRYVRAGEVDVSFANGIYRVETEEFDAILDVRKKIGRIDIYSRWSAEALVCALKNICIFLIFNKGGVVLHASGVVKKGRAYIFFGPSGSGKSTIAEYSRRYTILSEELIGIMGARNKFNAFAIPYNWDSRFTRRANNCFEIAGLFKLVKDRTNSLRAVPKPQAVVDFFIFPYAFHGLLCFDDFFGVFHSFIESVPCYELHFLPDNSFWSCIDESVN